MKRGTLKEADFGMDEVKKAERKKKDCQKYIVGGILMKIHEEQGTMPYLLEMIEPRLTKANRKLFGLPF